MNTDQNHINTKWDQRPAANVLLHVLGWIVALSLPYLLDTHRGINAKSDAVFQGFRLLNFTTNILWIAPFYLNAYLLIPRLFYARRYMLHACALILVFCIMFLTHSMLYIHTFRLPHFHIAGSMGFMLPTFMLVIAISTTFRIVRDKLRADSRHQEQQKENLKTELSFLRSQINPHFIFNILNNLVALDQLKSPELNPTILKLAALMQYMLYDTDEDRVSLSKEVEYLQSYIDLQQQRFGKKVQIDVDLRAPAGFAEIEPMLLIPFVENAFKHGVGMITEPVIQIRLVVINGQLAFSVRNRFNPVTNEMKDKGAGIGLGNVKRRIELLYDNNQSLEITQDDHWFAVFLTLKLH